MEKLRVESGTEIEVNAAGDIITIPIDDMNFIENYNVLLEQFERVDRELGEKEGTMSSREELKFIISKTREIMDGINTLFADKDCCKKVFGDIVPSPWLIADFLEKLCPIVEKYASERQKRIMTKYKKPVRTRRG